MRREISVLLAMLCVVVPHSLHAQKLNLSLSTERMWQKPDTDQDLKLLLPPNVQKIDRNAEERARVKLMLTIPICTSGNCEFRLFDKKTFRFIWTQ